MAVPEGSPRAAIQVLRPARDPATLELTIAGGIDRADAARLGREVRNLLEDREGVQIVCDLGSLDQTDVAVVDALCRMRLAARRRGCQLRLRNASAALLELVDLTGLTDVVPVVDSDLEVERQPEQGEHPRRVQEERDPADPSV